MSNTTKTKILCLHAKEDLKIVQQLETRLTKHLFAAKQNIDFSILSDHDIDSVEGKAIVHQEIDATDIFLLSISVDFLISKINTGEEMQMIMQRRKEEKSRVIPIILSACNWFNYPYATLQAIPIDGKLVDDKSWNNINEPLLDIVQTLERIITNR